MSTQDRTRQPIRILVTESNSEVRRAIYFCLLAYPEFELIGAAAGLAEAIKMSDCRPEVILIGLPLDDAPGVEPVKLLLARWPESQVIVLAGLGESELASEAVLAGAAGALLKDSRASQLADVIRKCAEVQRKRID